MESAKHDEMKDQAAWAVSRLGPLEDVVSAGKLTLGQIRPLEAYALARSVGRKTV